MNKLFLVFALISVALCWDTNCQWIKYIFQADDNIDIGLKANPTFHSFDYYKCDNGVPRGEIMKLWCNDYNDHQLGYLVWYQSANYPLIYQSRGFDMITNAEDNADFKYLHDRYKLDQFALLLTTQEATIAASYILIPMTEGLGISGIRLDAYLAVYAHWCGKNEAARGIAGFSEGETQAMTELHMDNAIKPIFMSFKSRLYFTGSITGEGAEALVKKLRVTDHKKVFILTGRHGGMSGAINNGNDALLGSNIPGGQRDVTLFETDRDVAEFALGNNVVEDLGTKIGATLQARIKAILAADVANVIVFNWCYSAYTLYDHVLNDNIGDQAPRCNTRYSKGLNYVYADWEAFLA